MLRKNLCIVFLLLSGLAFAQVRLGVDILLTDSVQLIKGKRVGLITNPTGMTSSGKTTVDAIYGYKGCTLSALFGPEHGVRGDMEGGKSIEGSTDLKTGVPVFSLYGKTNKPTPDMLAKVDVLVYDIQDIGSRAYTYIYTMALAMEAAKAKNIPFIVLDRPNPLGGERVEGPVLEPKFKSFIGLYPIPYIYGLTVGELAQLFNEEFDIHCQLHVVFMQGWKRTMSFAETGIMWVPTSPHIPHATAPFYCAVVGCIGELHTINEGVGWPTPFEVIGAPWINGEALAAELNSRNLKGVFFRPLHYRPFYFAFKDQALQGVQIHIIDFAAFQPMAVQLNILEAIHTLYPQQDIFATDRVASFDRAMGTDAVRKQLVAGKTAAAIMAEWGKDLNKYMALRKKYLHY